jgi:hypothetical protein
MPIYQVNCHEHGKQEVFYKSAQSVESAPCPACGADSPRDWVPVADMSFRSYWTDALTKGRDPVHITSRAQEKALCKEFGCARVN